VGIDARFAAEVCFCRDDELEDFGDCEREVWDMDWCRLEPDEG